MLQPADVAGVRGPCLIGIAIQAMNGNNTILRNQRIFVIKTGLYSSVVKHSLYFSAWTSII